MATAIEEIKAPPRSVEDRERDYFTREEFWLIKDALPDLKLELIFGQLVVKPEQGRDYFTIPEFELVADLLPDHRLELINGEIVKSPPPDRRHQKHVFRDMTTKPEIYAALKIPAYWIVDRRTNTVWVHTQPGKNGYVLRKQFSGDEILPAPGLEFLQISPAQIFKE